MIDKAFEALLSQGGVWAALFILAVGIGIAVAVHLQSKLTEARAELVACMEKRVDDGKGMGEVIQANGVVMTQQIAENAARTRAHEGMARASELAAVHAANLTARIETLSRAIETLTAANAGLREELLRGKNNSGGAA